MLHVCRRIWHKCWDTQSIAVYHSDITLGVNLPSRLNRQAETFVSVWIRPKTDTVLMESSTFTLQILNDAKRVETFFLSCLFCEMNSLALSLHLLIQQNCFLCRKCHGFPCAPGHYCTTKRKYILQQQIKAYIKWLNSLCNLSMRGYCLQHFNSFMFCIVFFHSFDFYICSTYTTRPVSVYCFKKNFS